MTVRPLVLFAGLTGLALAALATAAAVGSESYPFAQVMDALFGRAGPARSVILELRAPRALAAFATGGLLAVAGALMQVLLRNPLADPYVLGVSGGAAAAALAAIMLGLGGLWVETGAFTGALVAMFLVFSLSRGGSGPWSPIRLLLTGVVLASGFGAAISLMLVLGSDSSLRSMVFWLMGDLSFARQPVPRLVLLVSAALGGMALGRHLNVLARGDRQARALGVSVDTLSIVIYVTASLLTAVAVTGAGAIGFVGLVVPHMLRLLAGPDNRLVIPGAALLGGSLLVLADTAARTVVAPRQLPVGALTALIGVPLFLVLIRRRTPGG